MQVAVKEVLDNGYFRFLCIIVRLQMTSHISSPPIGSVTPVVVYRKSILSRTALIIYGRIRARQWVQRAVTLRRREVYETSLRTSSLCQVKGALRTPTKWRQPYRIFFTKVSTSNGVYRRPLCLGGCGGSRSLNPYRATDFLTTLCFHSHFSVL